MHKIKTLPFEREEFGRIKTYKYGTDWPVVYLIEDGNEIYIGETVNLYNRSRQHLDNPERKKLKKMHIISDDDFNKSSALDIESWLIQFMTADGKFTIQNANAGLSNHNYYQRRHYEDKFEKIWPLIRKKGLARRTLRDLKNSDLFKYSPYKTLNDEQYLIAESIVHTIGSSDQHTFLVHGRPGTGKTILAVYLVKYLLDTDWSKDIKVGIVVPMTSLRKTIKKVFKSIKGLKASMVLGPNDVVKDEYDLLIIDEAHRLMQRKNLMSYGAFDNVNQKLKLGRSGNQLDWIMKSSRYQILFYDEGQSVKPSDIQPEHFKNINATEHELTTQMRIEGGHDFLHFVEDVFDGRKSNMNLFEDYDFRIFDDFAEMKNEIEAREKEVRLSRLVAGYAWDWIPKDPRNGATHDFEIDGVKLKWNSESSDWVNSPNAINEVGCIHTVQGYDLNYVGVIVGPELSVNTETGKLEIIKEHYRDKKGSAGIESDDVLKKYIINIYKTLLTRGIKGCYVYFVDKEVEKYFRRLIK